MNLFLSKVMLFAVSVLPLVPLGLNLISTRIPERLDMSSNGFIPSTRSGQSAAFHLFGDSNEIFRVHHHCPIEESDNCEYLLRVAPSLLPDLLTLPPHDLRIVITSADDRKLLRFSNSVMNIGQAPAELWGERENSEDLSVEITQKIYRMDDSSYSRFVGDFVFHEIHGHWHWDNFSQYEIWTINPNGELDSIVAGSGKIGYCLRDNTIVPSELLDQVFDNLPAFDTNPHYLDCGWRRQGISPGWVDTYRYTTPGQYVDISSLEDGIYALYSIVDPDNRLSESNDANNAAVVLFRLEGTSVEIFDFPVNDSIK